MVSVERPGCKVVIDLDIFGVFGACTEIVFNPTRDDLGLSRKMSTELGKLRRW